MLYDNDVIDIIRKWFIQNKQTVAVAESVTAGHLQAALSSAIEASRFFQGGITTYNVGQKCRHLHLDPIAGLDNDCVAENVARVMAMSVAELFTSQYSIAITGYASKMPEKGLNDLYAWFAVSENGKVILCVRISTAYERVDAQVDYTKQVLKKLETLLREK